MNNELEKTERSVKKASNFTVLTIGMVLDGKYEIRREIARGGMGIVYEAYHKMLERKVAIKIILSDKISASQFRRFQKEVLACVNLSHPNIIKIYDAGIYNNSPYIVMEYIDGVDICKYVAQHDKNYRRQKGCDTELGIKRDWKLCVQLIYNTALALEYIHKKNMLHRDIKPSNIIVRSDGTPIIIDLGLVKFQAENYDSLTRTGEVLGTLQYMPIEQAQGKHHGVDARSDIYSLGLVLYELLTGEMAYSGKNPMEICYKIMSYYPPFPREINPQIPEVLEEITMHAIEKKKANRYATAQEFADELKKYLDDNNAQETKQNADELKKYLYDEHTQPPSKSEDALKKSLYDENTKETKQDKKQVLLQCLWIKKYFIACLFELIVGIVLIIAISSMLFSKCSGTSYDSQTKITESTQNEKENKISPAMQKPQQSQEIENKLKVTDLGKIKRQLQEKKELEKKELEKIKKQYDDFCKQYDDFNKQNGVSLYKEIQNRERKLKECENLEKEQTDLKEKIETKQIEINDIQKESQELTSQLKALESINKITDQRNPIDINSLNYNIEDIIDVVKYKIQDLEKELNTPKSKWKTLKGDRTKIKNLIAQFNNQKSEWKTLKGDRTKIENLIVQFNNQKSEWERKERDIHSININIEHLDKEITDEQEKINYSKKEKQEIESKRDNSRISQFKIQNILQNIQSDIEQITDMQEEINQLRNRKKDLEQELEVKYKKNDSFISKIITQIDSKRIKFVQIQIKLNEIKQGIQEEEKRILQKDLDSVISRLSLQKKEYDSLKKGIEELENEKKKFDTNFKNCQKDFQKKLPIEKENEIQQLKEQLKKLKEQFEKTKTIYQLEI